MKWETKELTHLKQFAVDKSRWSQRKERPRGTEHSAAAKMNVHATSDAEAHVTVGGQLFNKRGFLLLAKTRTAEGCRGELLEKRV